uniref:CRAL-TRIO domain-containing protein n=1 Tax=Helicotheca tamesis TaxID=374047 RepID=A0A7S2HGU9_9STRA|mmetsp:Transcript_17877/g.24623  ORF Transcript_17877/g.24623 Transcript_17877/m.24623 type:complete len:301 (+) Transcript_17877:97-999(+)|eukprot:CAMPEP_0185732000 /NCGR_PEP_ID=MMETSP1171-20130828/14600_1 /TAXON_ID=374046 /ORGANISM="Helicotheca tamensis, Strain CCMP826" /LENGTH=300 /DNA_ID=CAMNT_0028401383 /DNA_START=87 /DNA_END=989 /DNA_ORIENTATION=+
MTVATMSDAVVGEVAEEKKTAEIEVETHDRVKLVGEVGLLDKEVEKKGVEDILAALTDDEKSRLPDEHTALRHLRGEKGDAAVATKKLKATLQWRKEFGVEKLVKCFEEGGDEEMRNVMSLENKTGKCYVRGYDKEGRAVLYMRPVLENTKDEIGQMRHLVYNIERAIACTKRKSGLEKYNIIIDYKGFRIRDAPPMSTTKHTLAILQNHYPESLYRAYLFNPPMIFRTFWTMIHPFLDPVTKKKILFCHGKAGLKEMGSKFDMKTVEEFTGGTAGALRGFDSQEYLTSPLFDRTFDDDE